MIFFFELFNSKTLIKMYYSDEEERSDSEFSRTKKRRKRVHDICIWGFRSRENKHCEKVEYAKSLCKEHFFQVYRRPRKMCRLCCDEYVDSFGDGYCDKCASKMDARPKCKHEGCTKNVWSKRTKTAYCKEHDKSRVCRKKTCNQEATFEHYGFYYCRDHYPEKKTCKHVTKGRRCRKYWYSDLKDYGEYGFCYDHNIAGIDRCSVNSVTKKTKKYSGRCCKIVDQDKECKCNKRANKNGYCSRHQ